MCFHIVVQSACYCWFDSMAPFLCFYSVFHFAVAENWFCVSYSLILCLVIFRHLSMINININININTIITMNQFTVSPPSYNVKISVCESLLCFCFDSETVVLIVRSLCVSSFSEILSCAVSFLEISSLSCFVSCCLMHNTVSLLSVTLSACFSGWQCSAWS